MKRFLIPLLITFSFFFITTSTFADEKFTTSATTKYTIDDSGVAHAVMNIVIHNVTSNFYVTTYTLQVGFNNITNIKASDAQGAITPVIEKNDNGEQIQLQFNSIVYGNGTSVPFTLSFDTPDIAIHNGNVWELNIPGLANQTDFTDFTVSIAVPPSFGSPSYIKPTHPPSNLTFTKEELGHSGISLAFGKEQTYSFSLLYHLQNSNVFPIQTEIALPPSTNYQRISLTSLDPKPTNMRIDSDGNWLAEYSLSPGKIVNVKADGKVSVSLYPKRELLSDKDMKDYISSQPYWQISNKTIQELAKKLQTPETIYEYVVSHLTYDFTRVGINQDRLGALATLEHPSSAVCLEFTDLFITLSRAAGIPAREVDGYAYTQNTRERPLSLVKDVLHAWPEYYDKKLQEWIMVDPTWGNTTGGVDYFHVLDFDHIAFVIKGSSSSYPIPAGGYKLPGHEKDKDIVVTFSNKNLTISPEVDAQIFMNNSYISGFSILGKVTLINNGTAMFPVQTLSVSSKRLTPQYQLLSVPAVLPYGKVEIPFSFDKTSFLTNLHDEITIGFAEKRYTKSIVVATFTVNQLLLGGGIIFAIFCITLFIIAAKTWSVPVSKRR